jgi:hypothetical protein
MSMHLLKLAAASALVLSVAGCGSAARTSAVTTGRLDCPDRQGELRRVSAAADGKTCVYSVGDKAEVTLQLIPVSSGGPEATLAQIENQLKAEAAPAAGPGSADAAAAADSAAKAAAKAGDSARSAADAARKAAAEAEADAAKAQADSDSEPQTWDDKAIEDRVNAKLREKGIAVDEHGGHDDDRANVDLPGLHIRAEGDKADVHVGPIHINANGETATVRSMDDVRMRGEGLSRVKRGIRAMFVYAGDELGGGYKYVGYEASGPRTGPLAVAVVKSKSEGGFHGDVYGDVKTLVRRNGGT